MAFEIIKLTYLPSEIGILNTLHIRHTKPQLKAFNAVTNLTKLLVAVDDDNRKILTYSIPGIYNSPPADTSLQDVFRATVLAKLTYCSPAWSG